MDQTVIEYSIFGSSVKYIHATYGHNMAAPREYRPLDLNTFYLARGRHEPGLNEGCVMEFASQLAGEGWSDHPKCVSPVIAAMLRGWNDGLDDVTRQTLRPYAFRALDTRTNATDELTRISMALDWTIRTLLPLYFEAAHDKITARRIRSFAPLTAGAMAPDLMEIIRSASLRLRERYVARLFSPSLPDSAGSGIATVRTISGVAGTNGALAGILSDVQCVAYYLAVIADDRGVDISGAVIASALELCNAMCEVGRTTFVANKVRGLAVKHAREAWVDAVDGVPDVFEVSVPYPHPRTAADVWTEAPKPVSVWFAKHDIEGTWAVDPAVGA